MIIVKRSHSEDIQWHTLSPFVPPLKPMYQVKASAERHGDILHIRFKVDDPALLILWPESEALHRAHNLWTSTCFEAFFAADTSEQPSYFELNLSPSMAWNLYQFSAYRTPDTLPPPEAEGRALRALTIVDFTLHAELDLAMLGLAGLPLAIGLTTVIQPLPNAGVAEELDYLALHHPADQANFHLRAGWTIRLPAA